MTACARMAVMDRLLDYSHAPVPTLVLSPGRGDARLLAPRAAPHHAAGRRPKTQDEAAAQMCLYGTHTRSGSVTPKGPVDQAATFQYGECDIPPGVLLTDWQPNNDD